MNASTPQAYTLPRSEARQAEMASPLHLTPVGDKAVALDGDGSRVSAEAERVLLHAPKEQCGFTRACAAVRTDRRDPRWVTFP